MKRFTLSLLFLFALVVFSSASVYSQSCELTATNVVFESANSLIFDVYVKNTSTSNWTYSHGSLAWTYNPAFLNGGTPTFSLVPGFSDFPAGAQPPSALLSSPTIMRTSSNLPGANGVILAGQTLRLSRFRLQTSAASFSGTNLNVIWKTSTTPYTRIFVWDSSTGLPVENTNLTYKLDALLLEENFDFTGLLNANGWSIHSGTTNFINTTTGLTYTNYPGSGIGNAALVTNLGGEDINRGFTEVSGNGTSVYFSVLVNITEPASTKTGDYFINIGDRVSPTAFTLFSARLFAKVTSDVVNFGISNTSTSTYGTTAFAKNTVYLLIVKYTINTGGTDDVSLWVVPSGIPYTEIEAGTPEITNTVTSGQDVIDAFAIRQGSSTTSPQLVVDGIRVGLNWADILPPPSGDPVLLVSPPTLSGFAYLQGSGPSPSQQYSISGSNLNPLSGNISITAPINYEVSLNNTTFSTSVNPGYIGGVLASTPVYVRLKSGLAAGTYNGELITNAGGGAPSVTVTCNGSVTKPEPSNHVTSFNGTLGIPAYATVVLNWVDATGTTLPDGYLIKGSNKAFDSITVPIDGVPVANGIFVQNVNPGVQTHEFTTLNGGRTYYYKIFPYSNSGSLIDYKTDGTIPEYSITTATPPALPVVETFNYATGSLLTDNGWLAHSGAGTNSITVSPDPLTYTGYALSGTGKSVTLLHSGEDANRAFDSVKTGSVYASFLVNIDSAKAGDYFFHFGLENNTSLFFAKVFVKDSSGNLGFGIAKNQNTAVVYTPCIYSPNTTYLIVTKYTFNPGTTTDDEAKLWINPALNGIEPPADITHTDAGTDALALGMFALRQGGSTISAALSLGGIRISNSWIPSGTAYTLNLTAFIEGFWNGTAMVGDNVTVELRNSTSPYSIVEQQTVTLNNAGTGSAVFYNAANDVPYYIVIKHRNSLETWSALPQQFVSGVMSYNFSTAAGQAFGSNLVLRNTKWCIYSGDVTQDAIIDLQDMKEVDNALGLTGYLPGDVNGDGTITALDMSIIDTNSQTYVTVKKPAFVPEKNTGTTLIKTAE